MRLIETLMVRALMSGQDFKRDNTEVHSGMVFLHGNRIAWLQDGTLVADQRTLYRWPTNTTRSRLRALGFNVKGDRIIGGRKSF